VPWAAGSSSRFSIDTLVEMLARAGVELMVKVRRSKHALPRSIRVLIGLT